MFLGIYFYVSNPIHGFCVFIAFALEDIWLAFYVAWGVVWAMIFMHFINIPREMIYNGLYGLNGMITSKQHLIFSIQCLFINAQKIEQKFNVYRQFISASVE